MIDFGKGRKISPVVISTAFGHSGGGMFPYNLLPSYWCLSLLTRGTGTTVMAKSATIAKRKGNFIIYDPRTWKYIQRIPGTDCGMINAYGLTNPGAEECAKKIWHAREKGFNVIPNFYPEFAGGTEKAIEETLEAVEIYQKNLPSNFWAIELNYSCPNSSECIRDNVEQGSLCSTAVRKRFPGLIVIVKISLVHPHEFSEELESIGVDAIHAVNTIPYQMIYTDQVSPLASVGGGGVSGDPANEMAFAYNEGLRKKVDLPLIFGCGVRCEGDVHRYFDIGADAVSICSLAICDPDEATKILRNFNIHENLP
jgi:dihydroorotate dehydrogenase (NAD+) catalytic subunit